MVVLFGFCGFTAGSSICLDRKTKSFTIKDRIDCRAGITLSDPFTGNDLRQACFMASGEDWLMPDEPAVVPHQQGIFHVFPLLFTSRASNSSGEHNTSCPRVPKTVRLTPRRRLPPPIEAPSPSRIVNGVEPKLTPAARYESGRIEKQSAYPGEAIGEFLNQARLDVEKLDTSRSLVLNSDEHARALLAGTTDELAMKLQGAAHARYPGRGIDDHDTLPINQFRDLVSPAVTTQNVVFGTDEYGPDFDPDLNWRLVRQQTKRIPNVILYAQAALMAKNPATFIDFGLAPEPYCDIVDLHELSHAAEPSLRSENGYNPEVDEQFRSECLSDCASVIGFGLAGGNALEALDSLRDKRTIFLVLAEDQTHWTVPALDSLRPLLQDLPALKLGGASFPEIVAWTADWLDREVKPLEVHSRWKWRLESWNNEVPLRRDEGLSLIGLGRDYIQARRKAATPTTSAFLTGEARTLARRQPDPELTLALSGWAALESVRPQKISLPVSKSLLQAGASLVAEAVDRLENRPQGHALRSQAQASWGSDRLADTFRDLAQNLPSSLQGLKNTILTSAERAEMLAAAEKNSQFAASIGRRSLIEPT